MVSSPYLLLPTYWSSRNRARRADRGDVVRAQLFGGIGLLVFAALFSGAFWITSQLDASLPTGQKLQVRTRRGYLAGQGAGGASLDVR